MNEGLTTEDAVYLTMLCVTTIIVVGFLIWDVLDDLSQIKKHLGIKEDEDK